MIKSASKCCRIQAILISITTIFMLVFSSCSHTVTSEISQIKSYQVYITKLSEPHNQFPCVILQLHDSTLVILRGTEKSTLPADDILHIRVKIKRDAGRGALRGLVSGLVIGAAIGALFIDDHNDPASVVFGTAAVFGAISCIGGAMANTTLNLSYPINGRVKYYQSIMGKLEKYSGYGELNTPL